MVVVTLQEIYTNLSNFWLEHGCAVIPAYPAEVGAATFHPATIFNCCSDRLPDVRIAYLQPCVRPVDSRGGASKNRLYQHHQFQVLIKPAPHDIQDLYLASLERIGISQADNDIKFVEDNWENPSIGAYGLGWEVQMNGMEITQFTYMQQVGGLSCPSTPVELAYGTERIAMLIQDCEDVYRVVWNSSGMTYGDLFFEHEREVGASFSVIDDVKSMQAELKAAEAAAIHFINTNLPIMAFKSCLRANHLLNMLDASGVLGYNDRAAFILRIKNLMRTLCELWNKGANVEQ